MLTGGFPTTFPQPSHEKLTTALFDDVSNQARVWSGCVGQPLTSRDPIVLDDAPGLVLQSIGDVDELQEVRAWVRVLLRNRARHVEMADRCMATQRRPCSWTCKASAVLGSAFAEAQKITIAILDVEISALPGLILQPSNDVGASRSELCK